MGPLVCLLVRNCRSGLVAALIVPFLALAALPVLAQASSNKADVSPASAPGGSPDDGIVSIGGQVVMRLRSSAGGMSTEQRVDAIEDRLTKIVAVPDIKTSDVAVYTPVGKPPVIYVLGCKLITVDEATVKSAGGGSARQLATLWAKRLQQILPRVDIRLPNESEPQVPEHPALLVTDDLSQVGGNIGNVVLRGKVVMRLHGIGPGSMTAAERADTLSRRLDRMVAKLDPEKPGIAVMIIELGAVGSASSDMAKPKAKTAANPSAEDDKTKLPDFSNPPATIMVGGHEFYVVTEADARASGAHSPQELADAWVKNILAALGISPTPALAAPTTPNAPAGTDTPPPPPSTGVLPVPPKPPRTPPTPAPPNTPATPPAPTTPEPTVPKTPAQPPTPAGPQETGTPA